MKHKIIIMLLMACYLSGCSSLNEFMLANTNPQNGSPLRYYRGASYQNRAYLIGEGTTRQIKLNYRQNPYYSKNYPNSDFDITCTPTSNGAQIDLVWSSPTVMFPLGEYDLAAESTRLLNKREALQFTNLVGEAIADVTNRLEREGMRKYFIRATFSGQADGTPIRRPLYYRGEWGIVNMSRNETTLNGYPTEFKIRPGQTISNEELAALRSYGLMAYLKSAHESVRNIQKFFEVGVVQSRGVNYRIARVTITIHNQ